MKIPRCPHRWNVTPARAIEIQQSLADRVRQVGMTRRPRLIAGADMSISRDGESGIAGVVVWDERTGQVVEQQSAVRALDFPYVPGLLSFRETPVVLAALRKLRSEPDLFLFDAQGLAHPRGLGLACHAGVILDRPSVGCAKSRLCGEHGSPREKRGSQALLKLQDRVLGTVLRTRKGVKPVYVSVGHRVTLEQAAEVVLRCCRQYRLPEPTRLAHHLVTTLRGG